MSADAATPADSEIGARAGAVRAEYTIEVRVVAKNRNGSGRQASVSVNDANSGSSSQELGDLQRRCC